MAADFLNKTLPFLIEDDGVLPANVDYCYGVWKTLDDAWSFLAGKVDKTEDIKQGLTIGVLENGNVVEYQLKKAMPSGGYSKSDFVLKQEAGGKIDAVKLEGYTLSITDKAVNIPAATNTTFGVVKAAVAYNSNVNATITIFGVSGVALKECYKVPTWVSSTKQVEALIPSATVNRPGLITETWFKRFYETYQKVQSGNDFDPSKTYSEGDIVKYDNALWEFNQAHTGAWNASHATKLEGLTNIVEEAKAAVDAKLLDFERELYYVIYGTYPSD